MIPYSPLWLYVVPEGLIWSCRDLYGPLSCPGVQYGPLRPCWSSVVLYGPVGSSMVLYGPPFGFIWSYMHTWKKFLALLAARGEYSFSYDTFGIIFSQIE